MAPEARGTRGATTLPPSVGGGAPFGMPASGDGGGDVERWVVGSEPVGPSPSLVALTAVLFGAGGGYGLFNVATFELLDDVVPARHAVEGWTWLTTWQAAGLAAGAASAGQLAHHSPRMALLPAAAGAVLAAVTATTRHATLRRETPATPTA